MGAMLLDDLGRARVIAVAVAPSEPTVLAWARRVITPEG
jgi:hypothetical protein